MLYAGVLVDVLAHATKVVPATGAIGAAGGLLLLYVLVRASAELLVWPVALLGAAYGVALVAHGHATDDAAPLVAVGLFLCAELASWSIDVRYRIPAERAVVVARGIGLGARALASLAVAALAVALASAPVGSGLAWTILGAASAVAIVGGAVAFTRRV